MKFFILNAVLAASTVSSLVRFEIALLTMALVSSDGKMCVHVQASTAVMAHGIYRIGNLFQITLLILFAMVVAEVQTYRDTLSSRAWSHPTLTCALNYSLLYEDVHCLFIQRGR